MDKVARKVRTTVDDSHSNGPPQRVGKVSGMVTNVNLFTRCSSHHVHIVLIGTPGVLGANCYIRTASHCTPRKHFDDRSRRLDTS
eukprot:5797038-Pyramimonas_sp.AAC.3